MNHDTAVDLLHAALFLFGVVVVLLGLNNNLRLRKIRREMERIRKEIEKTEDDG